MQASFADWERAKNTLSTIMGLSLPPSSSTQLSPNQPIPHLATASIDADGADYATPCNEYAMELEQCVSEFALSRMNPEAQIRLGGRIALELGYAALVHHSKGAPQGGSSDFVEDKTCIWGIVATLCRETSSGTVFPRAGYWSEKWSGLRPQLTYSTSDASHDQSQLDIPSVASAWQYPVQMESHWASCGLRVLGNLTAESHARIQGSVGSIDPIARAKLFLSIVRMRAPWYAAAMSNAPMTGEHAGYPFYPLLYQLLRSSEWEAALDLCHSHKLSGDEVAQKIFIVLEVLMTWVIQNEKTSAGLSTSAELPHISPVFLSSMDQLNSRWYNLQNLMVAEAKGLKKGFSKVDPFEAEVLFLLSNITSSPSLESRADFPDNAPHPISNHVLTSTHDWAWHRLWFVLLQPVASLVSEKKNSRHVPYTLWQMGKEAQDYGASGAIDTVSSAYRYTELLLLSGLPELAVTHLAYKGYVEAPDSHIHDATHLGLALSWHGLLRTYPIASFSSAGKGLTDSEKDTLGGLIPHPDSGSLLYEAPASVAKSVPSTWSKLLVLDLQLLTEVYLDRSWPLPSSLATGNAQLIISQANVWLSYLSVLPNKAARISSQGHVLARAVRSVTGDPNAFSLFSGIIRVLLDLSGSEAVDVLRKAAALAQQQGSSVSVVLLWHSAMQHHVVAPEEALAPALEACVKGLASLVALPLNSSPLRTSSLNRQALRRFATELLQAYRNTTSTTNAMDVQAKQLRSVVSIFDAFDASVLERWQEVLQKVDESGIVPTPYQAEQDIASAWVRLSPLYCNFPLFAFRTSFITFKEFIHLRSSSQKHAYSNCPAPLRGVYNALFIVVAKSIFQLCSKQSFVRMEVHAFAMLRARVNTILAVPTNAPALYRQLDSQLLTEINATASSFGLNVT